jgi:DNA-binding NarL/FixJ family response regulator
MVAELNRRRNLLTPQERRTLALAAEGFDDTEIARQTENTTAGVRTCLHRVYRKLNLDTDNGRNRRVSAVLWYLDEG